MRTIKDGPVVSRTVGKCTIEGGHCFPVPLEMLQRLNSTDWSRLIRCQCEKKEKRLIDLYPQKNGVIDALPPLRLNPNG